MHTCVRYKDCHDILLLAERTALHGPCDRVYDFLCMCFVGTRTACARVRRQGHIRMFL